MDDNSFEVVNCPHLPRRARQSSWYPTWKCDWLEEVVERIEDDRKPPPSSSSCRQRWRRWRRWRRCRCRWRCRRRWCSRLLPRSSLTRTRKGKKRIQTSSTPDRFGLLAAFSLFVFFPHKRCNENFPPFLFFTHWQISSLLFVSVSALSLVLALVPQMQQKKEEKANSTMSNM